ncbi:hypothetical protein Cma02nite_21500 [Cellulomonas marina]|uniref:Uncharacterized protein n=2 Tax=Cellulomonas marina TaxID=988821 RepID=A0A1I1A8P6_9CELL|nr:hypothetical protein Cma02nite_21500 [Cellulomonas marina]SFB32918.1 hypothetical protein SAMN05421867_11520 [Cellulomonas marina]
MRIREVLLLPHTHHDVGYTHSLRLVDAAHLEQVGVVLDLAETDLPAGHDLPARPGAPDAFRWTFEVARPVLRFVAGVDERDVARLRRLVRAGRVGVTGGYLNATTLPSAAELDAGYEALGTLRAAGIDVRTEQHGDVNGIAWGVVEGMRRAGLTRLLMALNPDHGRPPLPQPSAFWWEGVSGARVLVWLSTHYGVGEEWGIVDGRVEQAEAAVTAFVAGLEARGDHPFTTALVHAGNDNRWPTARFTDVVRHWNARHPDVPMRTATVDEALDVLEAQARAAGDAVPVLHGEWSDWWAHGHGSTARELSVHREARTFALAAGASHGLARLRGGPAPVPAEVVGYRRLPWRLRDAAHVERDLALVEEDLLLFDEHTWGSWESFSKPASTLSHSAWTAKQAFVYEAWDLARDLAVEGLGRLLAAAPAEPGDVDGAPAAPEAAGDAARLVVVNPVERERTAPVEVEVAGARRVRAVVTVPAFGVAALPVPADPVVVGPARAVALGSWHAQVDPGRGGVVSLRHGPTGTELVDDTAPAPLGALVVERLPVGSAHPFPREPKRFRPEDPGPAFDRVVVPCTGEPEVTRGDGWAAIAWALDLAAVAPGLPAGLPPTRVRLVLHEGTDLVDLEVALTKPPVTGPESLHVAFPFAVPDAAFRCETAGAVFTAGDEQLPATSRDWYSVQHAVGVVPRAGAGPAVLWGTVDAPLVQLGRIRTGEWVADLDRGPGHLYSWLLNNLHFTNFQATQDATRAYRYRFTVAEDGLTAVDVADHGRDLALPLQARAVDAAPALVGPTGLVVAPADEVHTELRPLPDGSVRVRLRAPGDAPVAATVRWADGPAHAVEVPGHGLADVVLTPPR